MSKNQTEESICNRGFETDNDVLVMAKLLFSLESKFGKEGVLKFIENCQKEGYEDYEIIETLIVRDDN